jgi:ATP-binding cassette subfamily B (MDR/TAP) protein 1
MFVDKDLDKDKNIQTISEMKERDPKEVEKLYVDVEEKKELSRKPVGFFKLIYLLANKCDIALISFACLGSLIAGGAMPLISLLLGKVLNQFNGNIETTDVPSLVAGLVTTFLLVGIAIFLGSFMMVFFWSLTGRRIINKINEDYFRVIMLQEQAWFDQSNMFEFATKVQGQIKTIENGVNYYIYFFKCFNFC